MLGSACRVLEKLLRQVEPELGHAGIPSVGRKQLHVTIGKTSGGVLRAYSSN